MIARRLLMGGGGSFTPPVTYTLTSAPNGGWTQIPESRALYFAAYTYVGYVDGSGSVELVVVPDSTKVAGSPITVHATFEQDTHAAPALIVRDSDHKLILMYSGHNGAGVYQRISTNSLDSDPTVSGGFATETIPITGGTFTYPILLQRLAEASDPIYLFIRNRASGVAALTYYKSTDQGATWGSAVNIYTRAGKETYWKIATDGQYRIDFIVTDDNPASASSKIYHMYADATGYHQSDGTLIDDSAFPAEYTQLTEVYDSSAGPGWPTDAYFDGTNPRFVYSVDSGGTDSSFRYARWTGSAWTLSTILGSVGRGIVDPAPVASLNPVNKDCHLVRYISGQFEMYRYSTTDDGATWSGIELTTGSALDNIYPVDVHGHGAGQIAVLWLAGTYTSDVDNSLAVLGRS